MPLTKQQEQALERIKRSAERRSGDPTQYEMSVWDVTPMFPEREKGPVFVRAEWRWRTPGTFGHIHPDRLHVAVGVGGGIKVLGAKYIAQRKKVRMDDLRDHPLIYGWHS